MARKVFISFLGTNNYVSTHYTMDGKTSAPVRFIQEALLDEWGGDLKENDRIYIFYTEKSYEMNWKDGGQTQDSSCVDYNGLESIMMQKSYYHHIEGVQIHEGFSEDEIWDIFNIVYSRIQNGDEIYFDVTHAFRSIPIFSVVLFNFTKQIKDTRLKAIYYGAFEKLGPAYKVRTMPVEERVVPILDLINIAKLQNYNEMANSMVNYGRIGALAEALDDSDDADCVKKIANQVENLDHYIICNRMVDIRKGKYKQIIEMNRKALIRQKLPTPIMIAYNRFVSEMDDFVPEESDKNIAAAIEWAYRFDMLPQAYTLAQEYIISICTENLKEYNPYDKKGKGMFRMYISALLNISQDDIEMGNFKYSLEDHLDLTKVLLQLDWIKDLRTYFPKLSNLRNMLNHAKGTNTFDELKAEFRNIYDLCLNCITKSNIPTRD